MNQRQIRVRYLSGNRSDRGSLPIIFNPINFRNGTLFIRIGIIKPKVVRRLIIEDALFDTGATGLCLPKSLVEQLGLTPLRITRAQTTNGITERTIYLEVQYTVLERSDSIKVTDLPEDAPVLVGHMILEVLDLCVDMRKGLIHNPAHDGEWTIKIL